SSTPFTFRRLRASMVIRTWLRILADSTRKASIFALVAPARSAESAARRPAAGVMARARSAASVVGRVFVFMLFLLSPCWWLLFGFLLGERPTKDVHELLDQRQG